MPRPFAGCIRGRSGDARTRPAWSSRCTPLAPRRYRWSPRWTPTASSWATCSSRRSNCSTGAGTTRRRWRGWPPSRCCPSTRAGASARASSAMGWKPAAGPDTARRWSWASPATTPVSASSGRARRASATSMARTSTSWPWSSWTGRSAGRGVRSATEKSSAGWGTGAPPAAETTRLQGVQVREQGLLKTMRPSRSPGRVPFESHRFQPPALAEGVQRESLCWGRRSPCEFSKSLEDSSLHATRRLRERRRDASDGAGSPWLVLVREPDQLGVERKDPQPAFGGQLVELAEPNRHVAADDDRTPAGFDDDHLHAACVARRRDESEPGKQLQLAVDRHVPHAGRLDPLANGVVVLAARVVELPTLDVDRPAGEEVVAAAVVGVQVCVDDDVDAGEIEVLLVQWLETGIHVGQRRVQLRHASVDQHARIGMVDDVHVDRHPLALDGQVGNEDRRDGD